MIVPENYVRVHIIMKFKVTVNTFKRLMLVIKDKNEEIEKNL